MLCVYNAHHTRIECDLRDLARWGGLRRIAACSRDRCSSAGVGRGRVTVCGFGCSAPPSAGYPAVLGPMASSQTHFAPCGRCVQTVATKSVHEARCARWPRGLRSSAPHRRRSRWPTHGLVDVGATHRKAPVQRRGSAAVGGVVQALSVPAEDGGEANPGSRGGAGGRRLTAGREPGRKQSGGRLCRRAPAASPRHGRIRFPIFLGTRHTERQAATRRK